MIAAEDMVERHKTKRSVVGVGSLVVADVLCSKENVSVSQHGPFRWAGSAAGIQDYTDIVGLAGHRNRRLTDKVVDIKSC